MEKRAFKDAIYGQLARISKALSSPERLKILDLLCQRAWTVEELATETQLSVANTSRHLQVLRGAHLVETRKRGLFVEYRVADEEVCIVCHNIRTLAERQIAEIDRVVARFRAGRDEFVSIDRDTLVKRLHEGTATLIDVRPEKEYRSGHLAGAIAMPIDTLQERLRELPRDRQIVAYCRGPYCLYASDAVRLLRAEGYDAIRYEEGVIDWKAAGLPVATVVDEHPAPATNGAQGIAAGGSRGKEPRRPRADVEKRPRKRTS